MKIRGIALTEKKVVKAKARESVLAYVEKHRDKLLGRASKVEGKAVYYLEVVDEAGNTLYVNFDVSVSAKAPYDRAERKPRTTKSADSVEIE